MLKVKRKICLLGDGGVGKTSLIRRFVLNTFDDKYLVTIGTKVSKKVLMTKHPKKESEVELTMAIWDIMGHMGVTRVHTNYLSGARGALVVSDVSRKDTLDGCIKWIDAVREKDKTVPIILLANKCDLIDQKEMGVPMWDFKEAELKEFADKYNFKYHLTSAKEGDNVEEVFVELAQLLLEVQSDE